MAARLHQARTGQAAPCFDSITPFNGAPFNGAPFNGALYIDGAPFNGAPFNGLRDRRRGALERAGLPVALSGLASRRRAGACPAGEEEVRRLLRDLEKHGERVNKILLSAI